ncbi:hypothetical protein AAF712_010869 [Marasmius tenuissimus]|uniref:Uncharacterized protein n=1 Tax=Marasmius tenuissimus TaxID=585030 RepID=A0ABR2ZM12_9AGAR
MVDDGAMVVGLSKEVYERVKDEIGGWGESKRWMRMADGALVPGITNWRGVVRVKGLEVEAALKVFNSGGHWDFLFGKPLLETFKAVHDYRKDTLMVKKGKEMRKVFNEGLGKRVEVKRTAKLLVANVERVTGEEEDTEPRQQEKACNLGRVTVNTEALRNREVLVEFPYREEEIPTHNNSQNKDDDINWEEVEKEYRKWRRAETVERQKQILERKEWIKDWEELERKWERSQYWKAWRGTAGRRWWRWKSRGRTKGNKPSRKGSEEEIVTLDEYIKEQQGKKHANSPGGSNTPPLRGVLSNNVASKPIDCSPVKPPSDPIGTYDAVPVCFIADKEGDMDPGYEIIPEALDNTELSKGVFTRNKGEAGAFKEERVKEMRQVKIGKGLMGEERAEVEKLLREHADCFALSVSEVRHVKGAIHWLKVPEDTRFQKKVHQKPLMPPQREYFHTKIDKLLEAGVIEQCRPSDVKCIVLTVLAKKAHEGQGLRLNVKCAKAG